MLVRAICDVIGFGWADPGGPLGPLLPPIVQVNAVEGAVVPGDVVTVRLRVRVKQLVPAPIRDGEA